MKEFYLYFIRTKFRLKYKWNKFYVCDRVARLIEVRRDCCCGNCAGSGLIVAAYLKRSRSVRLVSLMHCFFTPFNLHSIIYVIYVKLVESSPCTDPLPSGKILHPFPQGRGFCTQASRATSNVIFHLSCFSRNSKLVNNNKIQCTLH